MKNKRIFILITFIGLLFNSNIKSQNSDFDYQKYIFDSLAIISDKDGYTNVRENPNIESKVLYQISINYIFKTYPNNSCDWWKIDQSKSNSLTGYVHKSRIKKLGSITNTEMKELNQIILDSTVILMNELHSQNQKGLFDTDEYHDLSREFSDYYHFQLFPVLNLVSKYYCNTQDQEFLNYYLDFMIETKGTAWEAPSFTLGEIFICNSDDIIDELNKRNKFERDILINNLQWGIQGNFAEKKLKKKIALIRKD